MAEESADKAELSGKSSLRSRWLDGTSVKGAKDEPSEVVPVKAKPKIQPEGLKQDPWEGKRCSPESELQGEEGGDPWANYHNAEPLSAEADLCAPRARGAADDRDEKRDLPIFATRRLFARPRNFGLDERVSHCMGRILRYRTEELAPDEEGFVELPLLLEEIRVDVPGISEEDLRRVAQNSFSRHGRRFQTREIHAAESGKVLTLIRATYRHMDDRPPRGRRRAMERPVERLSGNGGFSASPTAEEATPGHFVISSPRETKETGQRYDIEDEFAALHQDSPGADKEAAADVQAPATASEMSASTEATSTEATAPKEEVWGRFLEPKTLRVWFWNSTTEEVLYADDLEDGWEMFYTEEGQRWFWQESTGRYFFEEVAADK